MGVDVLGVDVIGVEVLRIDVMAIIQTIERRLISDYT